MLDHLLKIEGYLECSICNTTLQQATIVTECAHRFCLVCIKNALANKAQCPKCDTPASIDNLKQDTLQDNLQSYLERIKNELLTHTLTPLEYSLMNPAREKYQLEDSSMEDILIPSDEEIGKKRNMPYAGDSSTQQTAATEDDLEDEYNDFLPTQKKTKIDHDEEKRRMLNPKALLGDMFSLTQSQDVPTSINGEEESNNTQQQEVAAIDNNSNTKADPFPDTVYSDSEDNDNNWMCAKCEYTNKPYLQTCSVCHTFRNEKAHVSPSTSATTTTQSTKQQTTKKKKQPYELTVAADESALTVHNTRRRTESTGYKEVHIMYTGLTPEDEKKLEKIKEETDQKLKIIIHYQMRDFEEVTHIVTSVDRKKLCKRTLKYLQGVLNGKWIVDPKWVIDSNKSKKWQPEAKYEVKGDHVTGETNAPKKAREANKYLFENSKFYFLGDFTGKHNKNDLLILSRAGKAKILNKRPAGSGSRIDENEDPLDPTLPIVITNKDKKKKPSWLYQCQVRDPSWIIDCISKYSVE